MPPLHALLATLGTDGDVVPYLGLGAALVRRGHRVTLLASEDFADRAADHGLGFRALQSAQEVREVLENPDFWRPLKGGLLAARWGVRFLQRQYDLVAEMAGDANTVLVASPAILAARLVQEKLSRPLASIILQPWMIPSVDSPPVMPPGLGLPRWAPRMAGRVYFRLLDAVGDLLVGRHLNRLRSSLGLKPVRRLFRWWLSPELVIGMFPERYGPPQADWPARMRLAGFPVHDGRPGAGLPAEVEELCRAGSPPIAFTFGTGMLHAAELYQAAVEACRILGARGLLLTRHAAQLPSPLPPLVRHCEFAPFQALFPRCAAVVHHGGVGTTARALAAGTPQLVLPISFDQFDNAVRVKRLGAGDWLKPGRRSGSRIAAALAGLLTAENRARCGEVAGEFADGDALGMAARWIEELGGRKA